MKRTVVIVKKNATQSELDAAMLQVGALGAANIVLQSELDAAALQVGALGAANIVLQADNASQASQITSLNSQVASLTATNASQAGQISSLNSQVASLTATNASQASQITSLNSQVASLTATNASQAGQITSLNSQVASLTATNASQAGQISSLNSQVATLTTTNASQASQLNTLTSFCGGNSVTIQNTAFSTHANDVQTQGAKPASGWTKESYSVFISLTVPNGANCVRSFGLDWAGGSTLPAWNDGGWNTLGTITVKPWGGTSNTIAMFNYQVVAGGVWLHFYNSRRPSDSSNYLRVNRVEFGTF